MALSRTKKFFLVGGIAFVLIAIVAASVLTRRTNAVGVQFEEVKKHDVLESKVSASGEVRPVELYNLTAEVAGRVTDIYIKEGDVVKKNQPLLKVDPTQQANSAASAEASYRASEQDLRQTETQHLSAINNVNQTKTLLIATEADLQRTKANLALSEAEFKRVTDLLEAGVSSRSDFDKAKANYETAKATYQAQQAQVDRLKEQIKDAELGVKRAEAAMKAAEQRSTASRASMSNAQDFLSKTIKASPIDGVVSSLPIRVGEFALANFSSTPLMTIADMSKVNVEIKVDETDIANVKIGQPAKIKVDALGEAEIDGEVVEVGQSAVTRSGQTIAAATTSQEAKDFKVKVRLKPNADMQNRLRPGMSATAVITTDTRKDVIAIPLQALVARDKDEGKKPEPAKTPEPGQPTNVKTKREEIQGVFIEEAGKSKFVAVKTGITGETEIEITEGLRGGEKIIIGPYRQLRTLKDGTAVTKETKPEGGDAANKS
ncbi:MAG: HlyD family efflux transporter periplasmic adaptor subunit [Blastocatellia bacterium]|nr:HlyD family efflux transporter periplasmic adaptor subunit [Blastocatellia bacterium]